MVIENVRIPSGASTIGGTNAKGPAYGQEAAEDCWRRSLEFLRRCATDRADRAAAGS